MAETQTQMISNQNKEASATSAARKDIVTFAAVIAALIIFVGNGSSMMRMVTNTVFGGEHQSNGSLQATLLLNIALILFGWRRYRDLAHEVKVRSLAEERAQDLALKDPLTGFHNRRSMSETGRDLLEKARKREKSLAVAMFDLDHFKTINDLHGHAVGDALLRCVAAEITRLSPSNAMLARLGGDEFACVMAFDPQDRESVEQVVQSIVRRLGEPFDADGIHAHVSVSAGIANDGPGCETIDALMRHADIAMYVAKREGRNRFAWFNESMERALQSRSELESAMRESIAAGHFEPYFEKQIELSTGKLLGFEVLARWNHPTLGLVMPDTFIPIAEETGMINDLSFVVVTKALLAARDWDPELIISINISPLQLRDPWLAQKIVKTLTETGFPANRLEVEITESALFDNLEVAQSIVGSLKNQGIRLALDDFGTGYSSLAHLRALPFDRIKIDKSFVLSIEENQESAAIVKAITNLGQSLSMAVTAEGIEDENSFDRLNDMGCGKGQGWYFGKPMSIAATRSLLAQHNMLTAPADPIEVVAGETSAELDLGGFEDDTKKAVNG